MLDTLTAADQLTAAGFDSTQAKAIVAVLRSSEESAATKADLNTLKLELEANLKASLAQMETRLYRALLVQTLTIGGLVVALLKLL